MNPLGGVNVIGREEWIRMVGLTEIGTLLQVADFLDLDEAMSAI